MSVIIKICNNLHLVYIELRFNSSTYSSSLFWKYRQYAQYTTYIITYTQYRQYAQYTTYIITYTQYRQYAQYTTYIITYTQYRQYTQYTTYIITYTQFAKHHSTWYMCERLHQIQCTCYIKLITRIIRIMQYICHITQFKYEFRPNLQNNLYVLALEEYFISLFQSCK